MPCKFILLIIFGMLLTGNMPEVLLIVLLADCAILVFTFRSTLHLR